MALRPERDPLHLLAPWAGNFQTENRVDIGQPETKGAASLARYSESRRAKARRTAPIPWHRVPEGEIMSACVTVWCPTHDEDGHSDHWRIFAELPI